MQSRHLHRTGVVCHDAGGANQIFAMLLDSNRDHVKGYFEGPAHHIYKTLLPDLKCVGRIDDLLHNTELLISGTSWSSSLEHEVREQAQARRIYSIAVLDHWTNYAERFVRDGNEVFPDEIWVVDEYALKIAQDTFPAIKIRLQQDLYAKQQLQKIFPLTEDNRSELLYLLEPMRSDWGQGELGEFQALRYFFERLSLLSLPTDTVIRLRPHPSDYPGKYDTFLAPRNGFQVLLDTGDLSRALSRAHWVVGCQTYAMTIALRAGRKVYSSLPPWAPTCILPHQGLVHIKDLVSA